jgi:radical SAM superfamily enzyme YgiQ (UPF0313 family)
MAVSRDILLIHPWIYDFTAYDFWVKPLGLLYAAALLEKHTRHRLSFVDCLDRSHPGLRKAGRSNPDGRGPFPKEAVPKPRILAGVPRRFSRYGIPVPLFDQALESVPSPDAVLMTCGMTYWYPGVQAAIELVRRRFGRVPVVLGGIYASLCPEHAASQSGADAVAVGPAETSLFPALRKVLGDASVPDVPPGAGLDSLPPPSFGMLRDTSWLPVLASRGCPFRCAFCASRLLAARFEQRTPDSVAAEIEGHHARFGTRNFAFYDDALLANKERHIVPLLERLSAAAVPLRFHTPNGLHLRAIDPPMARLLRRAGFASLYLSLESADPGLLREKTPKTSPEELAPALAALESVGYRRRDIGVYLIAGLPGQDAASVRESIGFVRSLGATPRVAFFSPIPGTDEWEVLSSRGLVSDDTDPLLHNKLAFAYLKADFASAGFESIRRLLSEGRDSTP